MGLPAEQWPETKLTKKINKQNGRRPKRSGKNYSERKAGAASERAQGDTAGSGSPAKRSEARLPAAVARSRALLAARKANKKTVYQINISPLLGGCRGVQAMMLLVYIMAR